MAKPNPWPRRAEMYNRISRLSPCNLLLALLAAAEVPVVKTALINAASGVYWHGWVSPGFVYREWKLRESFDFLVADGTIIYKKGQPLILRED